MVLIMGIIFERNEADLAGIACPVTKDSTKLQPKMICKKTNE